MKTLLALSLLVSLPSGIAHAAPTLTNAAVLKLCQENAVPSTNFGWQDYIFEPEGAVKKVGVTYRLRGVVFGEPGVCVVTPGKEYATFKLDDPTGARRRFNEGNKALAFESKCIEAMQKRAGISDVFGLGYKGGPARLKGGQYTFTGTTGGNQFTCTGTIASIKVAFARSDGAAAIAAAYRRANAPKEPLQLLSGSCSPGSTFYSVVGEVKNNSGATLQNLMAEIVIRDEQGIIGVDDAFVSYKILRPGETSPFKVYVDTGGRSGSCSLTFKTFDGVRIPYGQ